VYFDRRLWTFTRGVRLRIAWAVFVGVLSVAVGVARLALLGWLLAQIFDGAIFAELVWPFFFVAVTMALRGLLEYARTMVAHRTAAIVQRHIRKVLYDKVIELGPAYFGMARTGSVIVTLVEGVEQLETYFGQYLPQLCIAALTPIGIFAFVAFLDLSLAAVMAAFALLVFIAPQAFHRWDRHNSLARSRAYNSFSAEFLDAVQGLATLKAFGQSRERARLLAEKAEDVFRSTMRVLATNSASRGITDAGIAIGVAVTLSLGAWRVSEGAMELSVLLIILMLGVESFRPLRDLRVLMHNGMVAQAASLALFELLNARSVITEHSGSSAAPGNIEPSVVFEDVRFTYPGGGRSAHDGLSFRVAPGERVGIVGPSGAGKSTIVKLLLRYYDPDDGAVRIGGRDIRTLSLAEIRSQLAVVSQDGYLFHGTVAENLRLGKSDASQFELDAATCAANAHSFISQLPQGYETIVGERGIKLSGGQRQRVAIARAILRDAPILVLDEALSAVDSENEAVIQEALDRLMQGRTTLIFAHRLSSVIDADRILVLEDGRVIEEGRHADLMARCGAYHCLMAAQVTNSQVLSGTNGRLRLAVKRESEFLDEDLSGIKPDPTDAIIRAEGLGWGGVVAELFRHIRPFPGRLMLTFLFGIARVVAFIGVGVVGALTVAALKNGLPYETYLWWLILLAPLAGILHWFESWIAHDMAFRLLSNMRIRLFNKLDQLSPAYMVRRRTGDLVAMATLDVETIEYFFAHTVAPAFVAVLVPGLVLIALAVQGWLLALALLPFLAVVCLSPFVLRHRVDKLGSQAREALGELNACSVDTVQGLAEIVAYQQADSRREGFLARVDRYNRLRLPFFRDLTFQTATLEGVTGLGGLAVIVVGAAMVQTESIDPAILPLLSLLAMAAFLPISEIAHIGRQLADTLGSTRRLYAVEQEPVPVSDGSGVPAPLSKGGVSLSLEAVWFTYEDAVRPALRDVTFGVPAGSTVALVGLSGAGKTTIAHLLMRFWDPDEGVIKMEGHDLRDYQLDKLRRQIALVAQDTFLFNDTLRANIMIANSEASEQELTVAVDKAALSDFVAELPDGLDTCVGERGVRLSGGQRQRVAIARAFLKDAPVLILDEATSHLDAVNEQAVRSALDVLKQDRTTVIIAHRLSTIRNADLIVVMDDGRVVETGCHEALLQRDGLYAHLVQRQLVGGVNG